MATLSKRRVMFADLATKAPETYLLRTVNNSMTLIHRAYQLAAAMASGDAASPLDQHELMKQILSTVQSIREDYQHLSAAVECIRGQVNVLSGVKQVHDTAATNHLLSTPTGSTQPLTTEDERVARASSPGFGSTGPSEARSDGEFLYERKNSATATSRIILTTYPGQSGIDPLIMNWGHDDALERGPVVVSRSQSTVRRRNGKRG